MDTHELRALARSASWDELPQSDQDKGLAAPALFPPIPNDAKLILLPDPQQCHVRGDCLLGIITARKSRRIYTNDTMPLETLSYLLYATQGYKSMRPHSDVAALRTVPSAGARHPIDTYLTVFHVDGVEPGLYLYQPKEHALMLIRLAGEDFYNQVSAACHGQIFAAKGSVTFFWAADMARCEWRYPVHAHRLVLLDVGHICQNLYLACEETGFGTCAIAAYDQKAADTLCGLDGDGHFVVYVAPVGKAKPE